MAYDNVLAERLRVLFAGRRDVIERNMFGGLAVLVGGRMCCGVIGRLLMARVGPKEHAKALSRPHVRLMDFTGRPLTGFVYVAPAGVRSARELRAWVRQCERFVQTLPPKKSKQRKPPARPMTSRRSRINSGKRG